MDCLDHIVGLFFASILSVIGYFFMLKVNNPTSGFVFFPISLGIFNFNKSWNGRNECYCCITNFSNKKFTS